MELEELLALLTAKFKGARKDGLEQLAAVIGLQCANKEEAEAIIEKLTEDKVKAFITDYRRKADAEISKATKTHEQGLRDKYNFVDKSQQGNGGQQTGNGQQQGAGSNEITLDAIRELVSEQLKGVITTFNAREAAQSYRKTFEDELDKAGVKGRQRDMMLRNFDRVNTFKTPDEFNTYLQEAQGDIAAIQQELADQGLGAHDKPLFGAVTKEGISAGVADFLAAQSKPDSLSGKEV